MDEKKFSSSWHESSMAIKPVRWQLLFWDAVFYVAIRDYVKPSDSDSSAAAIKTDSREWIFELAKNTNDDKPEYKAFSFPWCCRLLNMNPDKVRAKLIDSEQLNEIKRIIERGGKVDEAVIQFLKGDGSVQPKPPKVRRVPPKKDLPTVNGEGENPFDLDSP